MNLKRYYIKTGLLALVLSPLLVSIVIIIAAEFRFRSFQTFLIPPIFALILVWFIYAKIA